MWYLALYGILALWVLVDATKRKTRRLAWTAGAFLFGPIVVPIYLAKRPLKPNEVREGGTAWNVLKNFAIFWTVLTATAGGVTIFKAGQMTATLHSEAERVAAAIGRTLGLGFITAAWFFPFVAAVVVGLLLRKSSVVEVGPTGPLGSGFEVAPQTRRPTRSTTTTGPGMRCPQCGLWQMQRPICKQCHTPLQIQS